MEKEYIECVCDSAEHVVRILRDEDTDFNSVAYIEVQLNPYLPIWDRIKLAIKYVLGRSPKYGHWDITMLSRHEADKLINLLK